MVGPVVRADDIRRHNLGALLRQVHTDRGLTRAELTARLGLNRSTIGSMVAELVDMGLVQEDVPATDDRTIKEKVGRPSYIVTPQRYGPYAIAADIDGNRVSCAAVGIGGQILTRFEQLTPDGRCTPERLATIVEHAHQLFTSTLPAKCWPVGIGISVPGVVLRPSGRVALAPTLNWADVELPEIVGARLGSIPILVGNDANLAVFAERVHGSARGYDDVIYLIGRVGVGSGILLGGKHVYGHRGLAGEVGHIVLDPRGPLCSCGKNGCVETSINQAAAVRLAGWDRPANQASIDDLVRCAAQGDPAPLYAVNSVAEALGRTIGVLLNLFNPELIILGGWLTDVLNLARPVIERTAKSNALASSVDDVVLCGPGLGLESSLLGAAELAFASMLEQPFRNPADFTPDASNARTPVEPRNRSGTLV